MKLPLLYSTWFSVCTSQVGTYATFTLTLLLSPFKLCTLLYAYLLDDRLSLQYLEKEQIHHKNTMHADQFDQSPEQVTLTNTWHHTRKRGVDDDEIERVWNAVAAEKKKKPFRREKRGIDELVELPVEGSAILELTQSEVLEATVDQSSSSSSSSEDPAFDKKLISPKQKKGNAW